MEHLKVNKSYIAELEDIDYRMMDCKIKERNGDITKAIEFQFKQLDCSRVLSNGMRNIQTIDVAYKIEMGVVLKMIEKLDDNQKDEYISKLNALHENNLIFEKDNPPIDYKSKTKIRKTSSKHVKQTEFAFSKEVKAEQKLNKKLKQYANLNFKIKIK